MNSSTNNNDSTNISVDEFEPVITALAAVLVEDAAGKTSDLKQKQFYTHIVNRLYQELHDQGY